jgi:hypothetical protein
VWCLKRTYVLDAYTTLHLVPCPFPFLFLSYITYFISCTLQIILLLLKFMFMKENVGCKGDRERGGKERGERGSRG